MLSQFAEKLLLVLEVTDIHIHIFYVKYKQAHFQLEKSVVVCRDEKGELK